jgi:hypothetical protein
MSSRIRKPKHPRVSFSDPLQFVFGVKATNLGSFKDLTRYEQGVMLLSLHLRRASRAECL